MWSTECITMTILARSNKGCFLAELEQRSFSPGALYNAIYSTKQKKKSAVAFC